MSILYAGVTPIELLRVRIHRVAHIEHTTHVRALRLLLLGEARSQSPYGGFREQKEFLPQGSLADFS